MLAGGRIDPRTDDDNRADSFAAATEILRQAGTGSVLHLRELSAEDVGTLVQRRFGDSREFGVLSQRIHRLTQGHPFFVTETLQNLVLTEQLRRDRTGWTLLPHAQRKLLPRLADTILAEHIDSARPQDRRVYEVLALVPGGAPVGLLAGILQAERAAVAAALDNGVRSGLLHPPADASGAYAFRHELMREACAARCPPADARDAHLHLAAALAGTPAEAYHRLRAGDRTPQSRACFLAAASAFEERSALWEAERYYDAALAIDGDATDADEVALRVAALRVQVGRTEDAAALLLRRLPAIQASLLRGRYLHRLGTAYVKQGRVDEAVFHLQTASELYTQHAGADEQCRFRVDLVNLLIEKGDYTGAAVHARETLESLDAAAPAARAALMLTQARAELQSGSYEASERTCRSVLELLKPLGRSRESARAYTQLGTNFHFRGEFDQAERYHSAALKAYRELGDLYASMNAQNNIGLAQMRAGRLEEAIASFEESLDLKRQLGDLRGQGSGLNNLGNLWERRGEYVRALGCYRHGVRIFRRLQRPRELATLYNNMGEVYLRVGRLHAALRHLNRAAVHAQGLGNAYIALGVALNQGETMLRLLDHHEAARILNDLLQRVRESAKLGGLAAQVHACLAIAYARADDARQSRLHEEQALSGLDAAEKELRLDVLLALSESAEARRAPDQVLQRAAQASQLARELERPYERAKALRVLGAAHLACGDWDLCERVVREAMELSKQAGFRYELARCYKICGILRWDIGARERAQDDFAQCFALLEDLGLKTELGLTYLEVARLVRSGAPA
jgi:tetratricopeptide (TPR) repeat protein